MKIRDYQIAFADNIAAKLGAGKRKIACQLATGGGKTITFSYIVNRYLAKSNKSILILVDREELLDQARKSLYKFYGLDAQVIVAGMRYIPPSRVYVGMVETVKNRIDKLQDIGMVIIDEAHIASFHKMHEYFQTQFILGFTATPLTSNKRKPMKMFYDDICCGIDIPELIGGGYLCQNITRAPKDVVNRAELAVKGGEFDEGIMALNFSKPKYIDNTIKAYEQYSKHGKTIIFNVNIAHSKEVCKRFIERGYNCRHADGEMTKAERKEIVEWFKKTPDAILCNVGLYTKGFDEETIETVIVNKATMSLQLWLQMCGRGSRPNDAKSLFTIIDMGGNAITHGDWCQSRDWENIFWNPDKPGDGVAPVKDCPQCEAIVPASTRTCPHCGYEFPVKEIAPEEELKEFLVVTKGIDVEELIKQHENKKDYAPFFAIGKDLAKSAQNTIPQMTDVNANFILQKYLELGRQWSRRVNEKAKDSGKRKIIFNQWHRDLCQQHLFTELKKQFPRWETKLLKQPQKLVITGQ